jgi:LacI family transcriptional regulator
MVTLSEIAKTAGVSLTVASRALSDDEAQQKRVSAEALKHVRSVARQKGYSRNRTAEFLKRGQNPVIGVFLPPYEDSLIARLQRGLCREANAQEFPLSFHYEMSFQCYSEFLANSRNVRRCGIITYPYFRSDVKCEKLLQDYVEKGGKIISISPSTVLPWVPTFLIDNHAGGKLAGEQLASRGCENVLAYVTIPARAEGCGEAAENAGVDFTSYLTDDTTPEQFFREIATSVASGRKTGIFAGSDMRATEIYRFIQKHFPEIGIGPEGIPVVGYDNQYFSEWLNPALTTIDQPFEELGRRAMRSLIDSIYQRPADPCTLPPTLIKRQSA